MRPGSYSKVAHELNSVSSVPPREPPAPFKPEPVVIRGPGWKVSVPVALILGVVTSVASAIGARMLPLPTSANDSMKEFLQSQQSRDLKDEQWRNNVMQQLDAIRASNTRSDNELRNALFELKLQLQAEERRHRNE